MAKTTLSQPGDLDSTLIRIVARWTVALLTLGCARPSASLPQPATSSCFVYQNRYWARVGRADAVYRLRLHGSEVLAAAGAKPGMVLRGPGAPGPDVVWQVAYADSSAARRDVRRAAASAEFAVVLATMDTLAAHFEHSTFRQIAWHAEPTGTAACE